jgi:hypothetical protein
MQSEKTENLDNLSAGLPFFDPDWEPSPEDHLEMVENHLKELEDEKNRTSLYNPAEKKNRDYGYCKKKYGKVLADKMLRAKTENNGHLERDDYAELMRKHNNGSEVNKRLIEIKPKSKYNGQFVGISYSVIKNAKLRKILKRSMFLYLYLRSFIVRKKYSGDKLNLYEKYYKKGKLAACVSVRKLAKELYMDEKTVTTYLQDLLKHRVIEFDKIQAKEAYDNQAHNIYIMGTHYAGKHATYYLEELSTSDQ